MNKKTINFIATIVLSIILSQFLPWWSVMVAAIITGYAIGLKGGYIFTIPFLAIALLWMVHAFWLGNVNDFILAKKIAVLLPLQGSPYLLILVTGVIGGIAGGVAGVFGKQCTLLFKKNN